MFTRVVELVSKPGKSRELSSAINEKVVPILKKQAGFVYEIVLVSDALVCISEAPAEVTKCAA